MKSLGGTELHVEATLRVGLKSKSFVLFMIFVPAILFNWSFNS